MPRRIKSWTLRESGFVLSRSRNRREAIVATRKHPKVRTSAREESEEIIRCSQADNTAKGIGVASDLSKGIRVCDLRKSETVWLCKYCKIGRSNLDAIHRSALMCVIILVREGLESFLRFR